MFDWFSTTTTNEVTGEEEKTADWLKIGLVAGGAIAAVLLIQAAGEAARQETARQEAAARAARQETARREAAADAARQETARQKAAADAARQETARQKAAADAARQEAARQEAERQEAERREAARQEAARQEAARRIEAMSPETQADFYLVQTQEYLDQRDYSAAKEAMGKIIGLQEKHGMPIQPEFHFRYARILMWDRSYAAAIESLNQYLEQTGNSGTYYREALEMLHEAMEAVQAAALRGPHFVVGRGVLSF